MTHLLLTRSTEDNTRFLRLLPSDLLAKLPVIRSPLLQIQPSAEPFDLKGYSGVIFSSRHGVRSASNLTGERCVAFCVGERTADAATEAGWMARMCGATADGLIETLKNARPEGALLHLHGVHTRGDITTRLRRVGMTCDEKVVYAQDLLALTPEAQEALVSRKHMIVPLFSPRTAAHFASFCPIDADLTLIALSEAVAEAMPHLQSGARHVTKAPTAQAMAELLRDVATALLRVEAPRPGD